MESKILQLQSLADYNPKEGIKECLKFLKKIPNPVVKGLLALCYAKTGNEKAVAITTELINLKSNDPILLKVLSHCLKYQGHSDQIPSLYEHCWKISEELGCQYFMALNRTNNHKTQQQVSSYLYKTTNKPNYLSWSGVVLYLQSQQDVDKEQLLLTLAKKIFEKVPLMNWHSQYIYNKVLYKLKLFKDIIKCPLKHLDIDLQVIEAYKQLNIIDKVQECIEHVLERDFNENWELLKDYAEACTKHHITPKYFKHKSISGHKNSLLFTMYYNHLNDIELSSVFKEYFQTYKYQPSLFEDLQYVFTFASKDLLVPHLVDYTASQCRTLQDVIYFSNLSQFHFLFNNKNITCIDDFTSLLIKFPPKEEKEAHAIDNLLLICVYSFLLKDTLNSKLDALHCLLFGLKHRKYNIVMKLWAIELLCLFNHPLTIELYSSLEIKNIQVDMLSYIVLDKLNFMGQHQQAIQQSFVTSSIANSNEHETPEMLAQSFKFESYVNILEFKEFSDRISNSLSRYCAQTEAIRAYFMISGKQFKTILVSLKPQILPIPIHLVNNRDSSIYQNKELFTKLHIESNRDWCVFWYQLFIFMYEFTTIDALITNLSNLKLNGLSLLYKDLLITALSSMEFKCQKIRIFHIHIARYPLMMQLAINNEIKMILKHVSLLTNTEFTIEDWDQTLELPRSQLTLDNDYTDEMLLENYKL